MHIRNRSYTIVSLYLSLSFCFLSCKNENDLSLPLMGCCNNDPLVDSFGNAFLFLPNIFTPNNDGINDRFFPIGDSINEIRDFEIKDQLGLTVYHRSHFQPNDDDSGWDGYVHGKVQKGLYSYTITAEAVNGYLKSFTGKICNFPCGYTESETISAENCFSQAKWECLTGNWICEFTYDCFD